MCELKPAEVSVEELDELNDTKLELDDLSALSDTNLERDELSDTEDVAGLAVGLNESFSDQRELIKPMNKAITNSIWICFKLNSTSPLISLFQTHSNHKISTKEVLVVVKQDSFKVQSIFNILVLQLPSF